MPHILKNKSLEIQIDLPLEGYSLSRFDWTGKIVGVTFNGRKLSGAEKPASEQSREFGQGFYNEFGINAPIGFRETPIGGWFHKIGVGLLQKDSPEYDFLKACPIKPAAFESHVEPDKVINACSSARQDGYAYYLEKEIALTENGFVIRSSLSNTGAKPIATNEYNHNFICLNGVSIGRAYRLEFPFDLAPQGFEEIVNPGGKAAIQRRAVLFTETPEEAFFFSNLTGGARVEAGWELYNQQGNLGIRETGSFKTRRVNLWGSTHVISPELFFEFSLNPGEVISWSRKYEVFELPHP